MRKILSAALAASLLLVAASAQADKSAAAVPAPIGHTGNSPISMKIISYNGSVNGGMTVEVTNQGQAPATFNAQGLYFVPDGSPNQAPQRLGAVGPMQVDGQGQKTELSLAPGQKAVVHLDVYCIDSGRGAPNSSTAFHLSQKRMPAALANQIDANTGKAAKANGGYAAPAAKSAMQSEVWSTRHAAPAPLEGDGAQEKPQRRERSMPSQQRNEPLYEINDQAR